MEAVPALGLWDIVIEVFDPSPKPKEPPLRFREQEIMYKQRFDMFGSIDYVPPSLPISFGRAKLYLLEDNDVVTKMVIKARSPAMRNVCRTYRVDLHLIFERISKDANLFIKFVGTKEQLADILNSGSVECIDVAMSNFTY